MRTYHSVIGYFSVHLDRLEDKISVPPWIVDFVRTVTPAGYNSEAPPRDAIILAPKTQFCLVFRGGRMPMNDKYPVT